MPEICSESNVKFFKKDRNSITGFSFCLQDLQLLVSHKMGFPGGASGKTKTKTKNPPANAGNTRDMGLIPGSGRSPEGGHGNPLQYPCLENPMVRGVWRATVHGSQSWT